MIGELGALGLEVAERPVRDLWPLGLMRDRAGAPRAPVAVVRAQTYDQVADLLRWASGRRVTVVPMGAASGVCGALSPEAGQVVLDLTGFDRLLAIDDHDLTVHVQAGSVAIAVERALAERGLTLGHQPSSLPVSTIGGLISTRSSGQESSRYGNIEDMLLGVTAMLADGTLLRPRPGPRSAVGPALHHLLVGAEGGLAVILEAVLRVHRRPARVVGRGFAFAAVEAGLEAMRAVAQAGIRPLVMRLYDPEDSMFQGLHDGGCLFLAAAAGEPEVAEAEARVMARLAAGGRDLGTEPWERWRRHRYDLSAQRLVDMLEPRGSFLDTIEIAAPWRALPAVYARIKQTLAARALALCHFSHAYEQGCCAYFTFAGSAETEAEAQAAYRACWEGVMEACREAGATISHHHGVGRARAAWARAEMEEWWTVWEAVRSALDPGRVLNPSALGGGKAT